jgi:RNA polymerase sigma-70 factor (ECF subfamily)
MTVFRGQPELLEAFRRGDPRALERVYRAHVRGLDAYLRTLARAAGSPELSQPSAIADALQEVFVRAFSPSARMSFEPDRPFSPYLRAIARNLFVDLLRSRGREAGEVEDLLPESAAAAEPDRDGVGDPRVSAVLLAYIGALPDGLRDVYEQRFVLGHSQEDARTALGVSRRQLRTAEERLKRGLRKALVHAGIPRTELVREPRSVKPALASAALGRPNVAR